MSKILAVLREKISDENIEKIIKEGDRDKIADSCLYLITVAIVDNMERQKEHMEAQQRLTKAIGQLVQSQSSGPLIDDILSWNEEGI